MVGQQPGQEDGGRPQMAALHGGDGGLGLGIGVHPQAQSPTLQPSSSTFWGKASS